MPRGGKREGAGRKPSGDSPFVSISLMLRQDQVYLLEEVGEGNISKGARQCIDELIVARMRLKGVSPRAPQNIEGTKKRVEIAAPRL